MHRLNDTRYNGEHLYRTWRSGYKTVGTWGAISYEGPGPLIRLRGHLTKEIYLEMLERELVPYLDRTFPIREHENAQPNYRYFMQDK